MFKEGMEVEMIENCKDNSNIKEGWTGTIDYINYDGSVSVEFDRNVTGNGISGNGRNNHQWFIDTKQLKEIDRF